MVFAAAKKKKRETKLISVDSLPVIMGGLIDPPSSHPNFIDRVNKLITCNSAIKIDGSQCATLKYQKKKKSAR